MPAPRASAGPRGPPRGGSRPLALRESDGERQHPQADLARGALRTGVLRAYSPGASCSSPLYLRPLFSNRRRPRQVISTVSMRDPTPGPAVGTAGQRYSDLQRRDRRSDFLAAAPPAPEDCTRFDPRSG